MEMYGIFSATISNMEHSLSQVRSVWTDLTAQTYDTINDNLTSLSQSIWSGRESAAAGEAAVRENYNEGEFESILNSLGSRIASL